MDTPIDPSPLRGAELIAHINNTSARVIRGETPDDAEIRGLVLALRADRSHKAPRAGAAKKKAAGKKAQIPLDLNDLFAKEETPKAEAPAQSINLTDLFDKE